MKWNPFPVFAMILLATTACAAQPAPRQLSPQEYQVTKAIADKVSANWQVLNIPDHAYHLVAAITLETDGTLQNVRVVRSSGDKVFDASLVRAIRRSNPLPIPAEKREMFREFEMEFQQ